ILLDHHTGKISDVISRSTDKSTKTTMIYSRSIVHRVIDESRAVIMSDTMDHEDVDRSESMELMKIRSVMCVPLISRSQIRGVIYVDSVNRPYGFRKEDLSLLTTLASPAAIAIENALLYSNSEKIIEERTRSLKEAEQKLRESEARFKAVFNAMSSGVVIYEVANEGEDFIILDLNKANRKIEQVNKKDVLGKNVTEVFPEIIENGLLDVFRRVWETGKSEHQSVTLKRENKIIKWREYYVYRLPSGEVVSIFNDVTDQKKAEEEQKALQEQLLVSQKMESIGAFAGGTAHNFRNILQAILGNVEYLELVFGDKQDIKELSQSIYDSIEKGVDLINNLLHFSKRGGEYQMELLDLADVIMKTYDIIDKVFNKNIEIKLNVPENIIIKGNQSLLSQVFMNLFTNARDAMPNGGTLTIEAKKLKDKVTAVVKDTGHGMDKETLKKIFDPFFTLKDVGKGTGLGLSTTHGIVEQHGGSISVTSHPGKGTSFKIYFPQTKTKQVKKPEHYKRIIFGKGQKVLIVDDERPALESLTHLINRLGYEAIPVDKPVVALEKYSEWQPALVLMDRSMPEMDGVTCIKSILKKDPKAKILIVSGYEASGPDGIDKSTKAAIKGYITKPCGIEELSRSISKALKA
ncbi:MAG: response regulator, partial [Deltaproteobacteria bacterium]|nr:response regulator [Deltaproteobacteria bacterium]